MTSNSVPHRHGNSSNSFAHRRDAQVLWLLERHPATAGLLVGIGFFPQRKKASKRLRRLVQKKQIRLLGTVSLKDGRPEHVYGRGRWKTDNLFHEVQLTRLCLRIHADALRRGPGEVDPFLRPDAELTINGQRFFLEMDCGTMRPAAMRQRFAKYRSSPHLVLWVCPSDGRLETLRCLGAMIRETALFTTFDRALLNPHERVWIDVEGTRAALPVARQGGIEAGDKAGAKSRPLSPPASGGATTPGLEADTTVPGEAASVPFFPSTAARCG